MIIELKKKTIDIKRVQKMASSLREYDCDNGQFCFSDKKQWMYSQK